MVSVTKNWVHKAKKALENDDIVIMPTETVYGMAGNALSDSAIQKIYSIKNRPSHNPLIAHFHSVENIKQYVLWNENAEKLAQSCWPGPLTLILPLKENSGISNLATAGLYTLAVRMPAHPKARQLLAALDFPLVAPSANLSGTISPTSYEHVKCFENNVAMIIDGGKCNEGLESTIIDLSHEQLVILRPGTISIGQLQNVILNVKMADHANQAIKSPGLLEKHYAPSIGMRLNAETVLSNEALLAFGPSPLKGASKTLNLSIDGQLDEAAHNLYKMMRALDDPQFQSIAVMNIPNEGIGVDINNRLKRAAKE